jgi:flagellar biosynthetic protein FliR
VEFFIYHFQVFLLILARILGMLFVAPFFSSMSIRITQRILIAFLITTIVYPIVEQYRFPVPPHALEYGIVAISEAIIGILIGFIVSLALAAFQMAGQYFSIQLGFGMANVLDPMSQSSIPMMGTLYNLLGMFIFLIIGGHMMLIKAVIYSYQKINILILNMEINQGLLNLLESSVGAMFIIALKIALPLVGTLFLLSVTMGLISKAAPQMNILMMGFPVNILFAITILIALSPLIAEIMQDTFYSIFDKIDTLQETWPKS